MSPLKALLSGFRVITTLKRNDLINGSRKIVRECEQHSRLPIPALNQYALNQGTSG